MEKKRKIIPSQQEFPVEVLFVRFHQIRTTTIYNQSKQKRCNNNNVNTTIWGTHYLHATSVEPLCRTVLTRPLIAYSQKKKSRS